jgi:hypothetical protein
MAISTLDIRGTFGAPRVLPSPLPSRRPASLPTALRRPPVTVLVCGLVGILQGVALLAAALTGVDGVLTASARPSGLGVAAGLVLLAGWIVLCAGSGAALIDGAARRTVIGVALGELALVGALSVAAVVTPFLAAAPFGLPMPVVALLALAVPVAKLVLVSAPSAQQWVAQGPRVRESRPDPVRRHRALATLTLGVIAAGLVALTIAAPVEDGGARYGDTVSNVVYQP